MVESMSSYLITFAYISCEKQRS